ncbi:uncharacterized protein CCOS01_04864 [Colletotrichum costaricense]|uniref:Uncharacterized protein n=1 Tax=Colletotrichum costaricense TaxID=1209916 RepID=A0AAJ0E4U7_9PEZI|nr:uncharacterized protein CCOS01_04864 [Colletotrichum costaricense]KAK1532881.1 hypothetical protein CCOS01_04864 [Colletotrichum costaricense]
MALSTEFAKCEAVPTRADILSFRTATWLLGQFKAVNSVHGTTLRNTNHQTIADSLKGSLEERRLTRKHYEFLDCLASIFIRDREVVALVPSFPPRAEVKGKSKAIAIGERSNVVYLSANPRFDDHAEVPDDEKVQGPALFVDLDGMEVEDFDFDYPDGAVAYLYDKWSAMTSKRIETGQEFIASCLRIIQMLKAFFSENDGVKKAKKHAVLKDFIQISSQAKIRQHFENGTIYRNYVSILSTPVSRLAQLQLQKDDPNHFSSTGATASTSTTSLTVAELEAQAILDDEAFRSRPFAFLRGGREMATAKLELKFRKGQTRKQATVLEAVYKEVNGWHQHQVGRDRLQPDNITREHARNFPLFHSWASSPLNAQERPDYVFYDEKGRAEMQRILTSILLALEFYHKRSKEAPTFVNAINMKPKDSREDAIKKCKAISDDLQRAYFCLAGIRREFPQLLNSHLAWLQYLTGVTATHDPYRGFSSRPPSHSPDPRIHRMAIYAKPGTAAAGMPLFESPKKALASGTPATPVHGSSTAHQEPPTPGLSKGFSEIKLSGGTEAIDDNFSTELLSLDRASKKHGWDVAAAEYLGIVCRHYDSLLFLLESDQCVINRFLATEFQPVRTYPKYRDKENSDLRGFLETFELERGVKLPPHLVDAWVASFPNAGTFSGTWHCEATILSLHLLEKNRALMVDTNVVAGSDDAMAARQLPAASLTRRFRSLGTSIAVNKRCCPVCYFLVEYVQSEENTQFLYKGVHSDWSATTLPPWIPKEVFHSVYGKVLQHLRHVFQEKVYEDWTNRSDDSGGTRSAPGRSSAGSGPGADDQWYTQNQQSRKMRPSINFDTPQGGAASSKRASGKSDTGGTGSKKGKGGTSSGTRAGNRKKKEATSGHGGASGRGSGRRAEVGSAPPPFILPGASGRATNVAGTTGSQMGGDDPFVDTRRGGAPPGASQGAAGDRSRPSLPPLAIPPAGHSRSLSSPTKRHASSEVPHESSPSPKKK